MHEAVPVALVLEVPGVVAGGMVGEPAEGAGVPVLPPDPLLRRPFVDDVEAVAGGAEEGAGAAADAAGGDLLPDAGPRSAPQANS